MNCKIFLRKPDLSYNYRNASKAGTLQSYRIQRGCKEKAYPCYSAEYPVFDFALIKIILWPLFLPRSSPKCTKKTENQKFSVLFAVGGDGRDRTDDLLNAIQALSKSAGKLTQVKRALQYTDSYNAIKHIFELQICSNGHLGLGYLVN